MYVGRKTNDAILSQLIAILPFVSPSIKKKFDPIIPQPEDRLPNPYLFFSMDFDAPDGSDESRNSLLRELWSGHEKRQAPQEYLSLLRGVPAARARRRSASLREIYRRLSGRNDYAVP